MTSRFRTSASRSFFAATLLLASVPTLARAQSHWLPYGPDGGDARSFASDPKDHNHIYLGTVSGTIYDTHDGGQSWKRLARVGKRDDLVLDNIVVDAANPNHVLVGGWVLDHEDGGLYSSTDAGKTWAPVKQLTGHSIRALTAAPSDSKTLIIGALDGVYRSTDSGSTWTLITPQGSKELHEIESIAIDPKDPKIIYAGTWHLPWKTTNGGENWTNMKEGIIDDSDVFSIIVDPKNGRNVYLSACSGIYRSTDQGAQFDKVKGIPSSARRTRVLMEDAKQTNTVFAGTTEGLWKTTDSGHTFARYGDPAWIINDVNIDPEDSKRVLLATDRTGILLSNDGGLTFTSANRGFSSRQISAVAQDRSNPSKLYVAVINDKTAGGAFRSEDGGLSWSQKSAGLNGADIFSMGEAPDGTWLAGTRHGIFRLQNDTWKSSGLTLALPPEEQPDAVSKKETTAVTGGKAAAARARSNSGPAANKGVTAVSRSTAAPVRAGVKRSPSVSTAPVRSKPGEESKTGVYALASNDSSVFAATEEGLLTSTDNGVTWNHVRSANAQPWRVLAAQGPRVAVAGLHNVMLSTDKGLNFHSITAPSDLTYISAMAIDDGGRIWVGGREGVWLSENDGASWHSQQGLFVPDVSGIFYDKASSRVFVTANQPSTLVFSVHTPDMKVSYQDTGWALRTVRPVGDHLVGITPYDGIVLEPKMVVSQEIAPRLK